MTGTKNDEEKTKLDLLPHTALIKIANIFEFGAKKYGKYNWTSGFKWMRLYGACLRHLFAWKLKESADPESGKSHLHHAACCILMLIEHEERALGEDDRQN